jgi:SRSO17 transposase
VSPVPAAGDDREVRFDDYVARLQEAIDHQDRHEPLRAYLTGLCLPGERKSIEPMAARVDPRHVRARHQSMHHLVAVAPWNDEDLLRVARQAVLDPMERHGGVTAWVVDDTGNPKKGTHSVGVARQYCGVLGKQDNCQVAVSVSLVNEAASVPAAYQLFLPESWAHDRRRRRKAGVPDDVEFATKPSIALQQVQRLKQDGLPIAPVVADAGYGQGTDFRDQLTSWEIPYVVGISENTTVWPPGEGPLPPTPHAGKGRPQVRVRRGPGHEPGSVLGLARGLPASAWRSVTWREGTRGSMRSRFAFAHVRPAHRDHLRREPRPEEWLIIEWPKAEPKPTRYWFSTMPEDTPPETLVRLAKIRWRIERDYEELKDEFGLDHFEGRNWRGFHHHATLCIAAYAFVASERAKLSPPEPIAFLRPATLPKGFRPRGAPRARPAPQPRQHRDVPSAVRAHSDAGPAVPLVRERADHSWTFMTQ